MESSGRGRGNRPDGGSRGSKAREHEGLRTLRIAAVALLGLLGALACGQPTTGGAGQTGELSLLVTDAPSDDYAAINLTLTQIELLGGEAGPVSVSDDVITFDLLRLHDVSEPLLAAADVPVGHYTKIRLTVTQIELVDPDGSVHYADIPANGKIDLLPRGGFDIVRDEDLGLEIDIDANKSILVHATGRGLRHQFRPVVFVRPLTTIFDGRIARLHGRVEHLDVEAGRFDLCRVHRPMALLRKRGVWEYAQAGDTTQADSRMPSPGPPPHRRCRSVVLTNSASIFDGQGEPTTLRALANGDELTAVGRLARRHRQLLLHAELALLGSPGTFRSYRGLVAAEVDDLDRFGLEITRGQGIVPGSVLDVQLYADAPDRNGTKLYSRSGMAIDRDHIKLDLRASVTGILFLSNTDPDTVRAALVIVDLEGTKPDEAPVAGIITDVSSDPALQRIWVQEPDRADGTCVDVFDYTRIVIKADATASDCREGEYADLLVGDEVEVYGRPAPAPTLDCFRARAIVDYPIMP